MVFFQSAASFGALTTSLFPRCRIDCNKGFQTSAEFYSYDSRKSTVRGFERKPRVLMAA